MSAVTWGQYERRTEREWIGVKVRTLGTLANATVTIPRGTVLTVRGKFNGFELLGDKCNCCGVQIRITRVSYRDVEVVARLPAAAVHQELPPATDRSTQP